MHHITPAPRPAATRQKILDAAYELFSSQGANLVGVDTISARSGVAKMTLYHHFRSKENLVLAYLDQRAERWTAGWLKAGVHARAETPRARLLVIFDMLQEWFAAPDFQGCPFLRILSETEIGSAIHTAAAQKLAEIEEFIAQLTRAADVPDPAGAARTWMLLTGGAIMSACAGNKDAAADARRTAEVLVDAWTGTTSVSPASLMPASVKRRLAS